jgi:hypothetical protein
MINRKIIWFSKVNLWNVELLTVHLILNIEFNFGKTINFTSIFSYNKPYAICQENRERVLYNIFENPEVSEN